MKVGDKVRLTFGVIVHDANRKIGVILMRSPHVNYFTVEVSGEILLIHKEYLRVVKNVEKVLFS